MAENFTADFGSDFKEAVCVDAARVYDSCSDKDCLRDLRVLFPEAIQRSIIDIATSAKIKSVTVLNVLIDVENVPFNKGFYSVDMTYYFEVTAEVTTPQSPCVTVVGVATAEKKAILFGSDGGVRSFDSVSCGELHENNNMPTAKVQVVDPIVLTSKLAPVCEPCIAIKIPDCICSHFKTCCFGRGSDHSCEGTSQELFVTLGVFSIVQLTRRVQMLVPCYDFCIPDKECSTTAPTPESPCEIFSRLNFPTDQFFPPRLDIDECNHHCGC